MLALNSDDVASGVHEETLQATVLPEGADQTVTWESSDPKVATVSESTGEVNAIAPGTATITAKTANGRSATCKVYVDVVVVSNRETPAVNYVQDDIVVDPVKLQFNKNYYNDKDSWGWFRYNNEGSFTLTVVPADCSNITIQKCIFYHEGIGQSSTSTGPTNFSCEAFKNWNYCGINRVDVYFTRNN